MGRALSQKSWNLIFRVSGYFYKYFPFLWNIDNVMFLVYVYCVNLCIGNNFIYLNHLKFWFCHWHKRCRRLQVLYLCRLFVCCKDLHVKKISREQLYRGGGRGGRLIFLPWVVCKWQKQRNFYSRFFKFKKRIPTNPTHFSMLPKNPYNTFSY